MNMLAEYKRFDKNDEILPKTSVKGTSEKIMQNEIVLRPPPPRPQL